MNHPSADQLRQLLAQQLPDGEREPVEAHVNGCDTCLERLAALQGPRPFDVRLLAELLVHPPAVLTPGPHGNGREEVVADREPLSRSDPAPEAAPLAADGPCFPGYDVLGHVGRGGMGEIYKARHRRTNRMVALKTLPAARDSHAPSYQERLARFRTEVEAVSRLQHPNVISIYDVGDQDGRPYFTMEWVDGGSLAEYLDGTPQAERPAAALVALLARTIHYVHQRGIVHRDLKPANILLQAHGLQQQTHGLQSVGFGAPKITDFGVAKLLDKSGGPTQPSQWLGTPEYMAPEQTVDRPEPREIGPAADVYALGVLLYELLTGRPPFKADEPLETLRQVRVSEPVPPRRLRPRLGRDLETICLKCLHKEPRRRYASAQALADDLDRWLAGRAIQARPRSAWERTVQWAKQNPERAGLTALAAILVLALVAGFFWQWAASQADYTRQLAESADHQLLLVKYAVGQTAQDATLRELLADPERDRAPLRKYLEATKRDFARWFTRPGENPPIINWFVMGPQGTIWADSYEDPKSVGKNYAFRDYYAGLMGKDADRVAVYVSRVYESEQDERFKLTVITRVWEGETLLGLLGASLAVDRKMVALDMAREWPGARLVGPRDRGGALKTTDPEAGEETLAYVAILDPSYDVPGQKPHAVAAAQLDTLRAFARDPALMHAADRFAGNGCLVHYARVGDSQLVAVVERPYPWPLALLLQKPLGAAATLVTLLACGAFRRWYPARRRPPASIRSD